VSAGKEVAGKWNHLTERSFEINILYGNQILEEEMGRTYGHVARMSICKVHTCFFIWYIPIDITITLSINIFSHNKHTLYE